MYLGKEFDSIQNRNCEQPKMEMEETKIGKMAIFGRFCSFLVLQVITIRVFHIRPRTSRTKNPQSDVATSMIYPCPN